MAKNDVPPALPPDPPALLALRDRMRKIWARLEALLARRKGLEDEEKPPS